MGYCIIEIMASAVFHTRDKLLGLISVMWALMSQPQMEGQLV